MTNEEYGKLVNSFAPKSRTLRCCCNAFWTGGLICCLGQLLLTWFGSMNMDASSAAIYDDIAKLAGAGTLVPITGFANAIVAPAVEFRTEGVVLGTCAKMFTIAGPVLVFGTAASWLYGLIYWLWTLF